MQYTSDIDVLAVRSPHVFEEIGGQPGDWDEFLTGSLGFGRHIGLICEVKTGAFDETKLFRPEYLRYTLSRLGLIEQNGMDQVTESLTTTACVAIDGGAMIGKLFISPKEHVTGPYLNRSLAQIEDFLNGARTPISCREIRVKNVLPFPDIPVNHRPGPS